MDLPARSQMSEVRRQMSEVGVYPLSSVLCSLFSGRNYAELSPLVTGGADCAARGFSPKDSLRRTNHTTT